MVRPTKSNKNALMYMVLIGPCSSSSLSSLGYSNGLHLMRSLSYDSFKRVMMIYPPYYIVTSHWDSASVKPSLVSSSSLPSSYSISSSVMSLPTTEMSIKHATSSSVTSYPQQAYGCFWSLHAISLTRRWWSHGWCSRT